MTCNRRRNHHGVDLLAINQVTGLLKGLNAEMRYLRPVQRSLVLVGHPDQLGILCRLEIACQIGPPIAVADDSDAYAHVKFSSSYAGVEDLQIRVGPHRNGFG